MAQTKTPTVALPETRQLDLLAGLLERRGIGVIRCPMIAIRDTPHRDEVTAWLERFCARTMSLLVVYTGEGLQRLESFATAAGIRDRFVQALAGTPLLTRGPKPVRALRALGIRPEYHALAPTTAGVIASLEEVDLVGKTVGVQLYGGEPLPALTDYLEQRGATPDCVAPYVYASEAEDSAVVDLIRQLASGEVEAIAFTSKAQVDRMARVAAQQGLQAELSLGLATAIVAAIGPVAAAELQAQGVTVDVVPESDFFMKPMVTALLERLAP